MNGDFETGSDGLPFDWTLQSLKGAKAEIVAEPDGNRLLRAEFFGGRVAFQNVFQTLLLSPGAYRLTVDARSQDLDNERGLGWILSCAGGDKAQIAETPRLSGTRPWRAIEAAFQVPAGSDCAAQVLLLRLAARSATERKVSGAAWFDNVRIERIDAETAS